MRPTSCYNCLIRPTVGWSAYCSECQPVQQKFSPTGNQCLCSGCGEIFTTARVFDSHQSWVAGSLRCKDPRRMRDARHRHTVVLGPRGWAKNPVGFDTFERQER